MLFENTEVQEPNILEVMATLPEKITTPPSEITRIEIEAGGGGQFPVRIYNSRSDDFEACFVDLAD